uniref:Uncharacterized protein LOC111110299 isoform X1 n=1 Tax=Crassostrea virginica TaxID=6565 RepID=A0A8B8BGF0_CRAVI|nr:uncharacterized protein LOC111110299 isoform X1 [Crassostrea virginica]
MKQLIVLSAVLLQNVICIHQDEIRKILRVHNTFRRNYAKRGLPSEIANMNLLVWDSLLSEEAKERVSCRQDHFDENLNYLSEKQINVGITRNGNLTKVIGQWLREGQHFLPEFEACLDIASCKNFLTIINAHLRRMGCAIQRNCGQNHLTYDVFMCIYEGSHERQNLFSKGPTCTKCEGQTSFCNEGLCDTCTGENAANCDCRKTCERPGIGTGALDNTTCTCQCLYGKGPNCDEDCVNPQMYENWDICELITKEDCVSDDQMILKEYCPATCDCTRHPFAEMQHPGILGN